MDPQQTQANPLSPEQPVAPTSTPTESTLDAKNAESESSTRILDIIREIETAPTVAPADEPYQIPTPTKPAEAATPPAPLPEHIPTLAELGGVIGTPQGTTTTVEEISKTTESLNPPLHPQSHMEVYTAVLPHDPLVTGAELQAGDESREPLTGIKMDSIRLTPEEPKAPRTFSTSLTPEPTPTDLSPERGGAVTPPTKSTSDFIIPSIHTLRDDMKSVVQDQSMSIVRASALEERKKQARRDAAAASEKQNGVKKNGSSGIIVAILVFLVLGGSVAGGFWWYRTVQQAPTSAGLDSSGMIFAEQAVTFPLANSSPSLLKRSLASLRTGGAGSPGAVTRVIPTITTDTSIGGAGTTHQAITSEFFKAIDAQLPSELSTAVGSDIFIGVHMVEGNQTLVILPVVSYEHAFAGMLAWEGNMNDGLSPFFEPTPASITATDGSVVRNTFKDIVIKNYDVRMLSDAAGNPKLLYSFPNRDLLIITSSPYTLIEALARLQAARKL